MKNEIELTQDIVRELFDYNFETGVCLWKERETKWFKIGDGGYSAERNSTIWNKRFAGKVVGSMDPDGYKQTCVFGKTYKLHRLIWLYVTGEWPEYIDHKNGVRDDNSWENLQNVSMQENNQNMILRINNTSGYQGVNWNKKNKNWMVRIGIIINGKTKEKYLGSFDSLKEAHEKYAKEAKLLGYTERHIYGKQESN